MKKVKVNWIVEANPDKDDYKENPNRCTQYITRGFDKRNNREILVVGRSGNAVKIANLINTFGRMLKGGEKFDGECIHTIGKNAHSHDYRFYVRYFKDDCINLILLMPDFDWHIGNGETRLKEDIV